MLTPSQIDEFHYNGFLNGGRILTDDELNGAAGGFRSAFWRKVPMAFPAKNRSRCRSATCPGGEMNRRNSPSGRLSISGKPPLPLSD